jgi:predicted metal-binding protein
MTSQHTIFVCTTCASKWEGGKRVGETGGEKVLKQLQAHYPDWELNTEFVLEPVQCMSACNRSCVVSFAAHGKSTYLFGDISPDLSPSEVAGVFECAGKYYAHTEGLLPWNERKEPLKSGILARIPAVPATSPMSYTEEVKLYT